MTYQGHVENGTVVLDVPATLPEGAKVEVVLVNEARPPDDDKPLWQQIVELGESLPPEVWKDIPEDGAMNVDHYLYGAPKCEE